MGGDVVGLPPLVSVADVLTRLPDGVTVDAARVGALARDVSAAVRSYTKQDFTVRESVGKVRPVGYRLKLPQAPVVAVTSVAVRLPGGSGTTPLPGWYWDGSNEVWLLNESQVINLPEELGEVLAWQTPMCHVTYTHGYEQTPDDVVGVVCSALVRVVTAPGGGGVVSEAVGEYSYRLSDAAVQGPMMLTQAEKDALSSYRPRRTATAELRW